MTDGNAQTWQELADQLTPEQIAMFSESVNRTADELLDEARDYASQNLLQSALADVAPPAGTIEVSPWYHDGDIASRTIYAGRWHVGNITAMITGDQTAGGASTWQIEFREDEGTCGDLTAAQARELAQVLLEAADRLDRL